NKNPRFVALLLGAICLTATISVYAHSESKVPLSTDNEEYFRGRIDNQISLQLRYVRTGQALIGAVFREADGIEIPITGKMTDDGGFLIAELDKDGNSIGDFQGSFVSPGEMKGRWSKTGLFGPDARPFDLVKSVDYDRALIKSAAVSPELAKPNDSLCNRM